MCLCDTCRCSKALKIQVFAIFTDFESKSSVFNYSKSERNICFLATIWRNSRYERPRIHLHTGPQARIAVHCLKSVKTGNCLRAVQETKVHKTDEVTYHRRSYVSAWDPMGSQWDPIGIGSLLLWDPRSHGIPGGSDRKFK